MEKSVGASCAKNYAIAAEMLMRGQEFRAPHWTWNVYFQYDKMDMTADFCQLYSELVAMEEAHPPPDGKAERTNMRGALTYLDLYQRHSLEKL